MLTPRAVFARDEPVSAFYIATYVLFFSILVGASASVAATSRVTAGLLVSLAVSWIFVPLLHVVVAAALVASARRARVRGGRATALLLTGHAPWSLWVLGAAALCAVGGYSGYRVAVLLAVVPIVLTIRIVHAFCLEVLQTSRRGAVIRTAAHQGVTWLVAAIYLDRAVSLVPRILGWLS